MPTSPDEVAVSSSEPYGATTLPGEAPTPTIREVMEMPWHLRPWMFEQLGRWLREHMGNFDTLAHRLHENGASDYFRDIKRGWDSVQV